MLLIWYVPWMVAHVSPVTVVYASPHTTTPWFPVEVVTTPALMHSCCTANSEAQSRPGLREEREAVVMELALAIVAQVSPGWTEYVAAQPPAVLLLMMRTRPGEEGERRVEEGRWEGRGENSEME